MTNWTAAQFKQQLEKTSIIGIKSKKKQVPAKGKIMQGQAVSVSETGKFGEGWVVIPIEPMGAVRLVKSDAWKKRPAAVRYFDWKNRFKELIRANCGFKDLMSQIQSTGELNIVTYHKLPESWSKLKKAYYAGKPMQQKPDWDNVAKAVCDVLFKEDSFIHSASVKQYWCSEGQEACIMIKINN